MLRADESPNYWTNGSMAVLHVMARGYGHDHRDKMEIVMHAGGRLLYPDLNCIQYESPSINWTASTVAHNTLVVDRGKAANAPFTHRHDFTPEIKFLASSASCYPGVQQTRALALTREYLLDLFSAESELPHTYDWVLHALGKLELDDPARYQVSSDLLSDYWWIINEHRRQTAQTWRADFVQQNGLAIRGMGRQTDEWFNDRAAVRVTMIGEPGTAVYGADGPSGGPPVDPIMNPEGNSPLLLVRRNTRKTVFAAIHEPYKSEHRPGSGLGTRSQRTFRLFKLRVHPPNQSSATKMGGAWFVAGPSHPRSARGHWGGAHGQRNQCTLSKGRRLPRLR
jgi:hypothetical protein